MNMFNRTIVFTLCVIFLHNVSASEVEDKSDEYLEGLTTSRFLSEMNRIYGDTIEDRDFVGDRTAAVLLKPDPTALDAIRFRVLRNGKTVRNKESGLKIVSEEIKLDKNYKGFIGIDAKHLFIMYSPLVQKIAGGYAVQAHCILTDPPTHAHSSLNLTGETFPTSEVTSTLQPIFAYALVKKLIPESSLSDKYNFKPTDSLEDTMSKIREDYPALLRVVEKTVNYIAHQICPGDAEAAGDR